MCGEDESAYKTRALCAKQLSEHNCQEQKIPINASVAAAAALIQIKKGNASNFLLANKQLFSGTSLTKTKVYRQRADDPPVVQPGLPISEVKRRTEFPIGDVMLSFIIIVSVLAKFVSLEVDRLLKKPKENSRYEGIRPTMWDATNVSAYAFSTAHWQHLMYSQY
jgi:hypothetical protein